jgi:chromosomal replication initiator protein
LDNTQLRIESIQLAVAEHFSISTEELTSRCNKRAVVLPRQIAMYIAKCLTDASLPEIGRSFGGKHPTTVTHSIAKIFALQLTDPALRQCVQALLNKSPDNKPGSTND